MKKLVTKSLLVTIVDKPQLMTYKDVITEAHSKDRQKMLKIKPDKLYLHEKHQLIMKDIEK